MEVFLGAKVCPYLHAPESKGTDDYIMEFRGIICPRESPGESKLCLDNQSDSKPLGGLMVSALDSKLSGWGHCVMFLGKILNLHIASLHPGVNGYWGIVVRTT